MAADRNRRTRHSRASRALALTFLGMALGMPSMALADASNGVLRVGTSFTCSSLNPYSTTQSSCLAALRLLYPSLGQAGIGSEMTPDLAESWSVDETGQIWTFKLKSGGQWSDGQPVTAKDAAFTITMLLAHADGPTARRARAIANVDTAVASDDQTLVVTFKQPTANAVGRLAQLIIVPEHVWAPLSEGDGAAISGFANDQPVTGGAFTLARFEPDQAIIMQPNPHFYGTPTALKGVGIQFFGDSTAMVSALLNKQIDVLTPLPVTSVEAVTKAGLTVANFPGLRFHNLILNSSENQTAFPEIRDPKVREAFAHAIDRTKIASVAYLGYATLGDSMVPKVTGEWSNPAVVPEYFDLERANALLDEAGYAKGADGIRVANGHPMRYKVLIPANVEGAEGLRALDIVAADFKQIGVELVPEQGDSSTVSDAIVGPDNTYASSTIAQWGWIPQMDPDFILSVLLCKQIGGLNETGYCNPEYDELYDAQASEVDPVKRQEIVWKMQEIIQRDRPYIVTVQQDNIDAYSPEWTGFVPDPIGFLNYTSNRTFVNLRPAE